MDSAFLDVVGQVEMGVVGDVGVGRGGPLRVRGEPAPGDESQQCDAAD